MADQATAPHAEDIAPFTSVTSSLPPGGASPQDFDLEIYNHDILIVVQSVSDDITAQVLHLKNVREDTLAEAQTAVNSFFDQFEPLDNGSPGSTVFQMFNRVYEDTKDHVERALLEVDDVKAELIEVEYNDSLYPKRLADTITEGFNPVAEVMAACDDFLERVRSIQSKAQNCSKETRPSRNATIVSKGAYLEHGRLKSYVKKESAERNLGCNWYEDYYPGRLIDGRQPRFHVQLDQNQVWLFKYKDQWYSRKKKLATGVPNSPSALDLEA